MDLAVAAEVSVTTISNIESGKNTHPQRATVRRMARAFGVNLEDFYVGPSPKADGPSLVVQLLRDGPGHAYIVQTIPEMAAEAEDMTADQVRGRLDDLRAEHAFLKEAERDRRRFTKLQRDQLKKARRGYLVRALNLATIGGLAEQDRDRIVAEAA